MSDEALVRRAARPPNVSEGALRGPLWQRVTRGVYLPSTAGPPSWQRRLDAALTIAPDGAVIARQSAARWWGGVVDGASVIHLNIPPDSVIRRPDICGHRVSDRPYVMSRGRRVSPPLVTFRELAADLDLVDLVVLADSLIKAGRFTKDELRSYLVGVRGRACVAHGSPRDWPGPGVESPMETRLRLLLVLAGLPEPVVNLAVTMASGQRYRLDLAYPKWKIAIEYDGRQHAESTDQYAWDVRRRRDLAHEGWQLFTVTSTDVFATPGATLAQIAELVVGRGGRVRLGNDWRAHFELR